jgi:tRNA(Glu) U13 pseudouridine synthase TruD
MLRPGIKPNHLREVIEDGMGYQIFVERFRYLLRTFQIDEKEAVKELEVILFENVKDLFVRVVDWLGAKVDLPDLSRFNILSDMLNLEKVSTQEFKKEVKRLYESAKRRQQRSNPE